MPRHKVIHVDPRLSPYTPGAGVQPTHLAGRRDVIEEFDVARHRMQDGKAATFPFITGARGSGKTALFNHLLDAARSQGWCVGAEEAIPGTHLSALIAVLASEALHSMTRRHRMSAAIKRALGVLKAFTSVSVAGVTLNLDVEAVRGTADTGIFELDLRRLIIEIGEAAQDSSIGVLLALDEAQVIPQEQFRPLDAALHAVAQRRLPVGFLACGLFPSWQGAGPETDEPSFYSTAAARLGANKYMRLLPLSRIDARSALALPAHEANADFTPDALEEAVHFSQGNPWLIQLIGDRTWREASGPRVDVLAAKTACKRARRDLDAWYFPRILRECTPAERRVLRIVADLQRRSTDSSGNADVDFSLLESSFWTRGAAAPGDVPGGLIIGAARNALADSGEVSFEEDPHADYDYTKRALLALGRRALVHIDQYADEFWARITVPHLHSYVLGNPL
ncbi:ATP-binding protein [Streptomyces sp. NPDC013157]|uniref:ATP-binding protein n=1 Tax=Streptomyces sp. NPDC013157 TaxID=3364861 RepID=UPI003696C693